MQGRVCDAVKASSSARRSTGPHLPGPVSVGSDQCNGEELRPPLRDLQRISCFRAYTNIRDRVAQPLHALEPQEDLRPAHLGYDPEKFSNYDQLRVGGEGRASARNGQISCPTADSIEGRYTLHIVSRRYPHIFRRYRHIFPFFQLSSVDCEDILRHIFQLSSVDCEFQVSPVFR